MLDLDFFFPFEQGNDKLIDNTAEVRSTKNHWAGLPEPPVTWDTCTNRLHKQVANFGIHGLEMLSLLMKAQDFRSRLSSKIVYSS